ncbi:MAG: HNH endonuclease [Smithella sp.]
MKDEIISYRRMCDAENVQTLQRGMNYRLNPNYSVILMSQRHNAPYRDRILSDGITIEYEGHDIPKTSSSINPKSLDQPKTTMLGKLTQNGLFASAIDDYKLGKRRPEVVRAYEKIFSGVWSEKGFYNLIDYKYVTVSDRKVFRFFLEETEIDFNAEGIIENKLRSRTRIIPSEIKKIELHFDHDLPYSKGGTSITAENVRILCARHNLQKSNKIE